VADDQRGNAATGDFYEPSVLWVIDQILGDARNAFVGYLKDGEQGPFRFCSAASITI
jgi:hypothetical protein